MRAEPLAARRVSAPGRPRLVSTTRHVAAADPIEVFAAAWQTESRALWLRPASGEALVGIGSAAVFGGSPRQVAARWRDLAPDIDIDAGRVDGAAGLGPILLGGFGFDPLVRGTRLWSGFGAGRLVLPERLFSMHGAATWLTTNQVVDGPPPVSRAVDEPEAPARVGLSADDWQSLVGDVAAAIRRAGAGLRKVVLARATQVRAAAPVDAALRRLARQYPTCTIFAFATPDACFLGATPERLVALHNGIATTMALAGTAPRGATAEEDRAIATRLLNDPKERIEHAVVADALRESLAPLARRVITEAEPAIHALPNVQHLITPIRAQMDEGRSILDVVEDVHPTPAVGGYPRAPALELIRAREALDRGWYAGPIGWVDARGEGEFVVGLRSALVRGETATLFAGCGILGDSDPSTEYAEWGWKLRPMLTALGGDG
ncbi:MAG: isochorismate synthase [Chloroflexi bacterium]|nr:isochorismate synthase [Chloroflexota bacterium]